MAFEAGSVIVKLIADTTGFSAGTSKAIADMGALTVALGAATYSSRDLVMQFGGLAQELNDLSMTTGLSTEKLQKLQYAAALSGDSFQTASFAVQTLSLRMAAAADTNSASYAAFMGLGVDPNGRTVDEVFEDTAYALMGMEDTTKRNQIAQELYGRSWKEMIPFMEDYIKNSDKIAAAPTFSDENLKKMDEAKVKWDEIGKKTEFATGQILLHTLALQDSLNKYNFFGNAFNLLAFGDTGGGVSGGAERTSKTDISRSNSLIYSALSATSTPTDQAESTKSAISAITSAMRDYENAVSGVVNERKKLADLDKDFSRNLGTMNYRDTGAVSALIRQHNWDTEDQKGAIGQAAIKVGMAQAGVAKAAISIATVNVYGDKSFEKEMARQNRAYGVGTL